MSEKLLWLWGGCLIWTVCILSYDGAGSHRDGLVWFGNIALGIGLFWFVWLS